MSEEDYPKSRGSSNTSCEGYTVEARFVGDKPVELSGQLFDNRWRQVDFVESKIGVPAAPQYLLHDFRLKGLLGYSSAQALRWWMHAAADNNSPFGGLCLETKLVKHQLLTTSKCEAISEHCLIGGEDRSNCIPDWGKDTSET